MLLVQLMSCLSLFKKNIRTSQWAGLKFWLGVTFMTSQSWFLGTGLSDGHTLWKGKHTCKATLLNVVATYWQQLHRRWQAHCDLVNSQPLKCHTPCVSLCCSVWWNRSCSGLNLLSLIVLKSSINCHWLFCVFPCCLFVSRRPPSHTLTHTQRCLNTLKLQCLYFLQWDSTQLSAIKKVSSTNWKNSSFPNSQKWRKVEMASLFLLSGGGDNLRNVWGGAELITWLEQHGKKICWSSSGG